MKKYLVFIIAIAVIAAVGVFFVKNNSKTFYIKNSSPYLASLHPNSDYKPTADSIGDLSNTIIPSIKVPKNLTEDFAGFLAQKMISKNTEPKVGELLPGPGVNMPDPNALAENFIRDGLKKANNNILDVKPPQLQISNDNSKKAIEKYLIEVREIINNNLKTDDTLISILEKVNKNNGQGLEVLIPIISKHELTANEIELKPVPSSLKNLIVEEIQLLRVTANVLKALIGFENDPLGTIVATQQFEAILKNWQNLQDKFNVLTKKINDAQ